MSIDAKRLALTAIAGKLGCSPDSLRVWVRQGQRDGGERPGQTSAEKARSAPFCAIGSSTMAGELERENRELRQGEPLSAIGPRTMASEILRKASAYFAVVRKAMRHCFSAA